jgi:hypothetical protein
MFHALRHVLGAFRTVFSLSRNDSASRRSLPLLVSLQNPQTLSTLKLVALRFCRIQPSKLAFGARYGPSSGLLAII